MICLWWLVTRKDARLCAGESTLSILDTRVYRDLAEMVGSDHEAVFSKIRIKFRSQARFKRPPRLDSNALTQDERIRIKYRDTLYAELRKLQENPEDEDDDEAPLLTVDAL